MSEAARPPSEGNKNPSGRKKGGMPMYVTYSDLVQIGIFIVALVVACYTIFKGKKKTPSRKSVIVRDQGLEPWTP